MADEDNSSNSSETPKESVTYQRKKNIIGGIDNDLLLGLGIATAIGIGIVNLPQTQEFLRNVFRPGVPMQLPQIGPQLQQQQAQQQGGVIPPNGRVQQYQPQEGQQLPPEHVHVHDYEEVQGSKTNIPTTQEMIQQANDTRMQQEAYQQALDNNQGFQGNQYNSFNAVPERNSSSKKYKPYVPGDNVSAGLT